MYVCHVRGLSYVCLSRTGGLSPCMSVTDGEDFLRIAAERLSKISRANFRRRGLSNFAALF